MALRRNFPMRRFFSTRLSDWSGDKKGPEAADASGPQYWDISLEDYFRYTLGVLNKVET